MNLYRFRWAPGIALLAHTPTDSDGVQIRTWSTIGLPVRLSVSVVRQTREAYYGPAHNRPSGLWKRVLRAVVQGNGLSYMHYCPDLPPFRRGVELSVPRRTLLVGYTTRRHERAIADHHAEPCPACVAAGWRAPENAT
ncbi:hypothetical protein ACLQ16_03885 [Streptomyces albidoflavus]|uniref:hypothetical protein n=1 Tax=Streptomyces albidoflavus TaxID=1886 RepID=UPI000A1CB2CF|nr:hypothetical protein [Streptomyces albidoflavus]